MERELSNAQISKTLDIPETTIRYYRQRPSNLEIKKVSQGQGKGLGEDQIEGVLNPSYTKEVKETHVHVLSTVYLGSVDLGTLKVNQTIEEDGEIETILKPIYTKEVRRAIIKEIKPIIEQDVQPLIKKGVIPIIQIQIQPIIPKRYSP